MGCWMGVSETLNEEKCYEELMDDGTKYGYSVVAETSI